jgi:transcriptional regulator with XRE-family HTH domain
VAGKGPISGVRFNGSMYERFLQKWFGLDPVRARDRRLPDDPMVWIGGQVKASRIAASLTQMQLEELTGIDQTSISRLETGKGAAMRLDRFATLLMAIDAEIRPAERRIPAWQEPMMAFDDDDAEPGADADAASDAEPGDASKAGAWWSLTSQSV